jgi:hypothetical protein
MDTSHDFSQSSSQVKSETDHGNRLGSQLIAACVVECVSGPEQTTLSTETRGHSARERLANFESSIYLDPEIS